MWSELPNDSASSTADEDEHNRKCNGSLVVALNTPQDGHSDHLNDGEKMNSTKLHKLQINVVGLILGRHEQQQDSVKKLEAP